MIDAHSVATCPVSLASPLARPTRIPPLHTPSRSLSMPTESRSVRGEQQEQAHMRAKS